MLVQRQQPRRAGNIRGCVDLDGARSGVVSLLRTNTRRRFRAAVYAVTKRTESKVLFFLIASFHRVARAVPTSLYGMTIGSILTELSFTIEDLWSFHISRFIFRMREGL
jgi:hypothetical protein